MYCFIPKQKMKNVYLNNSFNILVNIVVTRYDIYLFWEYLLWLRFSKEQASHFYTSDVIKNIFLSDFSLAPY